MIKNFINKVLKDQKAEVNMIAIVLILIVVIILAVIFKDSMAKLLEDIFSRLTNDINNF